MGRRPVDWMFWGMCLLLAGCQCGPQGCGLRGGTGMRVRWVELPLGRKAAGAQTSMAAHPGVAAGHAGGWGDALPRRFTTTLCPDFVAHAKLKEQVRAALAEFQLACGQACSADFARGFADGYCDVATGGRGVVPAVPPPKYWGSGQRDPVGNEWAREWFAGFSAGSQVAFQNGAAAHAKVPTGPGAVLQTPPVPSWARDQGRPPQDQGQYE